MNGSTAERVNAPLSIDLGGPYFVQAYTAARGVRGKGGVLVMLLHLRLLYDFKTIPYVCLVLRTCISSSQRTFSSITGLVYPVQQQSSLAHLEMLGMSPEFAVLTASFAASGTPPAEVNLSSTSSCSTRWETTFSQEPHPPDGFPETPLPAAAAFAAFEVALIIGPS